MNPDRDISLHVWNLKLLLWSHALAYSSFECHHYLNHWGKIGFRIQGREQSCFQLTLSKAKLSMYLLKLSALP